MENIFSFKGMHEQFSPQLIINRKQLIANTDKVIKIAGSTERLWPHVKTHKTGEIVRLLVRKGITSFKCATIAEAEMTAKFGGKNILLAYPLVGPNTDRLIRLQKAYPDVTFHALLEDRTQMKLFSEKCVDAEIIMSWMVDVNVGQYRTGVNFPDVPSFIEDGESLPNLRFTGLHCYDGHRHESDLEVREMECEKTYSKVMELASHISHPKYIIMGGTPSFPCYAKHEGVQLSPGTLFLNDVGYSESYPDLVFKPAAAVFTRVISNPKRGLFTLDLGYKGIAADPAGLRGKIVGMDNYELVLQNEEHWVFKMTVGHEDECPAVGDELFVVPTHICPTSALYPYSVVVEDGEKVAEWQITARNRKITY